MGASVHKAAGNELRRELPGLMGASEHKAARNAMDEKKSTWADGCQ